MQTVSDTQAGHPLGPLATLAASAYEWRTRETAGGTTWAGLWYTRSREDISRLIAEYTRPLDTAIARQLSRAGHLPGVREFSHLIAFLTLSEQTGCVDSTTGSESASQEEEEPPPGIPIFDHGELEQARLSEVRHAIHLVRHLDDFHEPTVATMRRRLLRQVTDADDPEQYRAAGAKAADVFLEEPTYWRDAVETAVYLSTIRALETLLGGKLTKPERTSAELAEKVSAGMAALALAGAYSQAQSIASALDARLTRLRSSRVVLMYEEHRYLQLMGITGGKSVRRHLPRGLHLVYSDQLHRREDRTAGLWLATSDEYDQAGPYHFAPVIPSAYASRKRRDYFRLPDEDAVRRYAQSETRRDVV